MQTRAQSSGRVYGGQMENPVDRKKADDIIALIESPPESHKSLAEHHVTLLERLEMAKKTVMQMTDANAIWHLESAIRANKPLEIKFFY
jgi:hypothetical protein